MKKLSILILLMSVVIFTQSCKKKTEEPAPVSPETHLLKTWKLSKIEDDDPTTGSHTVNAVFRITFAKTGGQQTATVSNGGVSLQGTWTLSGSTLKLTASFGGITQSFTWTILSLTDKELKYSETETSLGKTVTTTTTMIPA